MKQSDYYKTFSAMQAKLTQLASRLDQVPLLPMVKSATYLPSEHPQTRALEARLTKSIKALKANDNRIKFLRNELSSVNLDQVRHEQKQLEQQLLKAQTDHGFLLQILQKQKAAEPDGPFASEEMHNQMYEQCKQVRAQVAKYQQQKLALIRLVAEKEARLQRCYNALSQEKAFSVSSLAQAEERVQRLREQKLALAQDLALRRRRGRERAGEYRRLLGVLLGRLREER